MTRAICSLFLQLGKDKWAQREKSAGVDMAEAFYTLVRLRQDFSVKELDQEQASQCFPHGTLKVRGPRSSVGKAQSNHKNNINIPMSVCLILKVNDNFIFNLNKCNAILIL